MMPAIHFIKLHMLFAHLPAVHNCRKGKCPSSSAAPLYQFPNYEIYCLNLPKYLVFLKGGHILYFD